MLQPYPLSLSFTTAKLAASLSVCTAGGRRLTVFVTPLFSPRDACLCDAYLSVHVLGCLATMSASDSPHGYEYPPNDHDLDWDWNTAFPHDGPSNALSFFDTLLNPTIHDDPAFDYARAAPYDMSSSRAQPGRLSNGYVDLTSPHVDLTTAESPPRRRKRESPTPGPSSKRQRREQSTAVDGPDSKPANIESIDLSQDDTILDVLQKQRQDAIKSQAKPEETVTTFSSFNCVICMDRPTDITATACGMFSTLSGPSSQY